MISSNMHSENTLSCFTGGRGIGYPHIEYKIDSSYSELWDEDEQEEVISLPMVRARELIVFEDLFRMEDIFSDLNAEGQ